MKKAHLPQGMGSTAKELARWDYGWSLGGILSLPILHQYPHLGVTPFKVMHFVEMDKGNK